MTRSAFFALLLGAVCLSAGPAVAQTAPPKAPAAPAAPAPPAEPATPATPPAASTPVPPNDYAKPASWLCLPGHKGACDANEDATVVAANGTMTVEKFAPAKTPAIDCFYVYPTVSRDPGTISTMNAEPEELAVVAQQFARFGQVCRQFAPLYRQFTLAALSARLSGKAAPPGPTDRRIGYNDVVDAWNYYLAHYNTGRGVVLIGHSQGSGVLTQLIKNEIDGKPVQKKLVSAILMGTRLQVPAGKATGGDLPSVPLCHSSSQTGCVIAYASFRATVPPTATSMFARTTEPGLEAACVNPAALAGGSGEAHAYLAAGGSFNESTFDTEWVKGKKVGTQFVSVPGLLTAECARNDAGAYLAITVHGDPAAPRTADIHGDVVVGGKVQADWGLHLIDVNLFMGNLLSIVRDETAAYRREKH